MGSSQGVKNQEKGPGLGTDRLAPAVGFMHMRETKTLPRLALLLEKSCTHGMKTWREGTYGQRPPPPGTCLSAGGGGGSRGDPPPLPEHTQSTGNRKNYWRMNNSAHGNVMLSVVNKGNSSLNNSGFPHLTNTQQLQQSGKFTISCQMTVIFLVG